MTPNLIQQHGPAAIGGRDVILGGRPAAIRGLYGVSAPAVEATCLWRESADAGSWRGLDVDGWRAQSSGSWRDLKDC